MDHICRWLALALLVVAQPTPALTDDAKVTVLSGTELLRQCSRESPAAVDGTWTPTPRDIVRLEALLPEAFASTHRARNLDALKVSRQWARQYVGVLRGGSRYLYGNFFPADSVRLIPDWRTKPIIICDGGPDVFGIEMNIRTGQVSHLAFNGP